MSFFYYSREGSKLANEIKFENKTIHRQEVSQTSGIDNKKR